MPIFAVQAYLIYCYYNQQKIYLIKFGNCCLNRQWI